MIIKVKEKIFEHESMFYINYSIIDELTNKIFYNIYIPKELKVKIGDFVKIRDDEIIKVFDKYEIEKTHPELLI
jgi:hypothetical protein